MSAKRTQSTRILTRRYRGSNNKTKSNKVFACTEEDIDPRPTLFLVLDENEENGSNKELNDFLRNAFEKIKDQKTCI